VAAVGIFETKKGPEYGYSFTNLFGYRPVSVQTFLMVVVDVTVF